MRQHFVEMEERRLLYVLRHKKASSVCGVRDGCFITRSKQKACLDIVNAASFKSSPRSHSLYSERQSLPEAQPVAKKWKYRVRNRDNIPNFFA